MYQEQLFKLEDPVEIEVSQEKGTVIGVGTYLNGEPQYLIRYKDSRGTAVEGWWAQSALRPPLY